jgi:hypothetical protein
VREFGVGDETAPFESAGFRDGEEAGPVFAERGEARGVLADVAVAIGVDDIFRGDFPTGHGLFEFLPILCAVKRERAEVAGCAGLGAYPMQRQRTFSVFPEDWPVAGEF